MKLARYGIIPYLCNEDSVANDYRFLDSGGQQLLLTIRFFEQ